MSHHSHSIRIGISVGDYNGIGHEVILKTLRDNRILHQCTPVVYGSSKLAAYFRKALNIQDFAFNQITSSAQIASRKLNWANISQEEIQVEPGKATEEGGKFALASLKAAIEDLKAGVIDALVTAPINKHTMQQDGFRFPGHTEYLANEFGASDYLMLLCSEKMRVGTVTGHIAIQDVSKKLNPELILRKLKVMQKSLMQDFGINNPRIAVLGLNPHAGENGLMGKEEQEIIEPAIRLAKDEKIMAFGPYPADGFFGTGQYSKFDGIMAMYHDQGLIPFKALSFDSGVNFTAGLSVIRTSPDHGTGYDIAGKGVADESSFRSALYAAIDIAKTRKMNQQLEANAIQPRKQEGDRDGGRKYRNEA